jgi:hypothetical protein
MLWICQAAPWAAAAQTVWNGPSIAVSNATQPDQITDRVWITRGSTEGIYNAVTETGFTHYYSPADTEWADGTTAKYASLSYTNWNYWAKDIHGGPPSTVNVPAVVHLITDDIYIDIMFTSWSQGGAYSYQRATPAVVNTPPFVAITNPPSGAVFAAPANVTIQAAVTNGSGTVTNLEFLVGTGVLSNETGPPFAAIAGNLAAGGYNLSVIATDNNGLTATSSGPISVVMPVAVQLTLPVRLSVTNFQFSYSANMGLAYIVQRSTNLAAANWLTLATNPASASLVSFADTNVTANPAFYRVARLPNP